MVKVEGGMRGLDPALNSRRGISLLEVLVSIFVLSIGLLSVTALIPAGQVQVLKGVIEDRRVSISQLAFAEGRARGVFRPFVSNGGEVPMWLRMYDPTLGVTNQASAGFSDQMATRPWLEGRAVVIDPLALQNTRHDVDEARAIDNFPFAYPPGDPNYDARYPYGYAYTAGTFSPVPGPPAPGPVMKRLTLRASPVLTGHMDILPMVAAAERFINRDDLTFIVPADPELSPVGVGTDGWATYSGFSRSNAGAVKRSGDPRYSWLYTIVPLAGDEYLVSTVVFRDRIVPTEQGSGELMTHARLATREDRLPERMVRFRWATGWNSFGGGEAKLTSYISGDQTFSDIDLNVQIGDWVMVRGMQGAFGGPTTPMFRWYRIRSVSDIENIPAVDGDDRAVDGDANDRWVSLEGPDWRGNRGTLPALDPVEMTATIMPNIISVTERVIRLE